MPNQNSSDPNQNQSQETTPSVPLSPQADLPPLPPEFQGVVETKTEINLPSVSQSPSENGSAAPQEANITNLVNAPKKKFGTKKVIATILGVLMLIGGIGVGITLLSQKQLFQQRAVDYTCENLGSHPCVGNVVQGDCFQGGQNNAYACYNLKGNPGIIVPDENCICPSGYPWKNYEYGKWWCFNTASICDGIDPYAVRCSLTPQQCGETPGPTEPPEPPGPTNTPRPTPTGTPPPGAPYCSFVKVYDTEWNPIISTSPETSSPTLQSGIAYRFTVKGMPTNEITKAKFKFTLSNGTVIPKDNITTKKPNTNEYYVEYIVPENTTSLDVKAWVNDGTNWY